MAEGYQTEEEQIETLKKWWKENGKSTIVSISVAVIAVFGWQGWQKQQQAQIDAASAVYQNMLTAAAGTNGTPSAEQLKTATHLAGTIKQDYPDSTYAHFAAFYKAKLAVESDDLAGAEQELRWVLEQGPTAELALQAKLRLARVLYAQDKLDEALAQLGGDASGFATAFEETRGDIYQAQGKEQQALLAYQKASELNQQAERPANKPMLEMKLQQLKSKQGQAEVSNKTANNEDA